MLLLASRRQRAEVVCGYDLVSCACRRPGGCAPSPPSQSHEFKVHKDADTLVVVCTNGPGDGLHLGTGVWCAALCPCVCCPLPLLHAVSVYSLCL